MKRFQVDIKAENLLLNLDGDHRLFSMDATCFVRADDAHQAGKTALARLLLDPSLKERLVDEGQSRARYDLAGVTELGRLEFFRRKRSGKISFQPRETEPS